MWSREETVPLTRGLPTRQAAAASPFAGRPHHSLMVTGRRYVKYALAGAFFLVVGNLMLTLQRSLAVTNMQREDNHAPSTGVAFPGAMDEIHGLPGLPSEYTSRLFSGYLPLANGGQAFYFLAESQSITAPSKDPVLLWLNGGPGASSLNGCFTENGPLLVSDDGQSLRVNEQAWNMKTNLLCIESPVGVGFSYNASDVYASDDLAQADDLYDALQQFFVKFPWLRANDFVISGESYGGIYVPTTALAIVKGNARDGSTPRINLKKFVVGNGVNEFMGSSTIRFAYYNGILSTESYRNFLSSCSGQHEFEKGALLMPMFAEGESACADVVTDVYTTILNDRINMYDITGSCAGSLKSDLQRMVKELVDSSKTVNSLPHPLGNTMNMCLNSTSTDTYFNLADVRTAMHTNPALAHWSGSTLTTASMAMLNQLLGKDSVKLQHARTLDYKMPLQMEVTPLWRELLANGVPGVIYHGDADLACNAIGGLWAVESLELPRLAPRTSWTYETLEGSKQTGGFVEAFENLTYVTVKGAGHLVPMTKPVEAMKMLDMFVLNDVQ